VTVRVRTIEVPTGLKVSLAEAGAGGRPLLLLHGFCGAKEDFADWLDRLAGAGWHAVAYDQRGHGASGHPSGESAFTLPLFAADVVAVADRLGWARFVLLGHSMGGMVAQVVALAHPERLGALILMDTGPGAPDGVDPALAETGRRIVRQGGMAALVDAQRSMGADPLAADPHARVLRERPGYREFCEAKTRRASVDMWLAMTPALLAQDDRLASLTGLAMPVLVVVGEDDTVFIGPSRAMAAAVPGARLAVLAGGGHSPQFEAPGLWWEAVSGFLSEV
jgi:pimeloyl-ACP methyl ester carboxylesterase